MKNIKTYALSLALGGLALCGCVLTSAQVLVTYDLVTPLVINNPSSIAGVNINLSDIGDYEKHKDKLKQVSDLALLGEFENLGGTDIDVEVWMTPAITSHTTDAALRADPTAVRVWGAFRLPAGQTRRIGWNESAALFGAGKGLIASQVRGDGSFTLYALGAAGTYSLTIRNGTFLAVLDAGV
jgi:hypothetical protein